MKYEKMLFIIFLVIFAVFSILSPNRFFQLYNFQTMLFQLPEFGLIALGMMICISTGGINLSISATTALTGILGALFICSNASSSIQPSILIIMVIGISLISALLIGIINGFFIAILGVAPILVTIGTRAVFEGIGLVLTKGGSISGFPDCFNFIGCSVVLGIPFPLIIFFVISIIIFIILHKTPWGIRVFMVGSNPIASNLSGISVKKILFQVYILSSLLAGIAGIIMISRYNSGKVTLGSSYLLQAVAAAVLGGTSISGGKGNVLGVIIATAILQVISTGMNILGINRFLVTISMGLILILALTANYFWENSSFPILKYSRKKADKSN